MDSLTTLFLWGDAAVAIAGQDPGRGAYAVVGVRRVHAVPVPAVGWVLALIHTCGTANCMLRRCSKTEVPRYFFIK